MPSGAAATVAAERAACRAWQGRRMPVQQSVDVAVPLETAYNQWTQFEDWPEFMHRVTRVTQDDDCTVSFATKIWGKTKEFEAKIETQRPDERIKWSVSQGITHSGVVTFHELAPRLTRIELTFDVAPGSLIEKAARGMRHVKRAARADLHRFKAFIEMEEHRDRRVARRDRGRRAGRGARPSTTRSATTPTSRRSVPRPRRTRTTTRTTRTTRSGRESQDEDEDQEGEARERVQAPGRALAAAAATAPVAARAPRPRRSPARRGRTASAKPRGVKGGSTKTQGQVGEPELNRAWRAAPGRGDRSAWAETTSPSRRHLPRPRGVAAAVLTSRMLRSG